MMTRLSRRFTLALLLLAALISAPLTMAPAFAAAAAGVATHPPTIDDFKATLSGFGHFIYSERYGNVWQPSSLPVGWHPYPACHWVYDRSYGWTYDDPTPWGKIVHHYGRWAHDDSAGWIWLPGTEWSPAWVVWRSGAEWTGWAPTPPATDQQEVTLASFNSDKQWTFMETAKLANRCEGEPAAAPAGTLASTTLVTSIKVVRGVAVYVMPQPVNVTIVDFDTGPIAPWPSAFLGDWITWFSALAPASQLTLANNAALCAPAGAGFNAPPPPAPLKKSGKKLSKPASQAPPGPRYRRGSPERPPVTVEEGPEYDPGPPVYVDPPRYRRPPRDWGDGPVIRVPPYDHLRPNRHPRPVLVPQEEYQHPPYPRRRRPRPPPGTFDEPSPIR